MENKIPKIWELSDEEKELRSFIDGMAFKEKRKYLVWRYGIFVPNWELRDFLKYKTNLDELKVTHGNRQRMGCIFRNT